MKEDFHSIPISPPKDFGLLHCTRCNEEFHSSKLICGHRTNDTHLHWFCPTSSCYGHMDNGIYAVEVSD
jgi:uncharacterized C2H2 Zn-finger protein